jgi:hypothetical protein
MTNLRHQRLRNSANAFQRVRGADIGPAFGWQRPDGLPRVDHRPQNAVMLTFTLGALTVPQSLLGRAADLIE